MAERWKEFGGPVQKHINLSFVDSNLPMSVKSRRMYSDSDSDPTHFQAPFTPKHVTHYANEHQLWQERCLCAERLYYHERWSGVIGMNAPFF